MPKQNRYRRIGSVDFGLNAVKTLDLPRALLNHYLSLRLTGQVDIATAVATAWGDAPWSLIRRVEVVADGKDTIKSIPGEFLRRFNRVFYGTDPSASAMPTAIAPNQAFNAHIILPFEMPRSVRPIDTLLDTGRLATLQLAITWGDGNSVYSTTPANITLHDTSLEVSALEAFGITSRFAIFKQLSLTKDLTAATTEFQIILPVGNLYRALIVDARNYGAAPADVDPGTGSNAIINNLQLKSGTEVFYNKRANETQDDNKRLYGVENWPAGLHIIEFAQDGLLTEALDARGLSSLEMILDVANPATLNKVKVYPMEMIPPPQPPAPQARIARGAR